LRVGLARQQRGGGRLGEVLTGHGLCDEDKVWTALARQWRTPLHSLAHAWVDRALAHRLDPATALGRRVLPLRARPSGAVVAMADPNDEDSRAVVEEALGCRVRPVVASPQAIRRRQEAVYGGRALEESISGLEQRMPDSSAFRTTTFAQRVALLIGGGVTLVALFAMGGAFFILLTGVVIFLYAAVVGFRFWLTYRGGRERADEIVTREEMTSLTDLPVYTILCPLYREAGVLPQLVNACTRLDYPKSKLDVKLLLEEDDVETIAVVRSFRLPAYFDVLIVPAVGPRTKPKACNYGLQFARGEYVVIFDAEDVPEPDQLRKALVVFRRYGDEIGSVQGKLNYYNSKQNVLTGWFTLEYTAWFDFFLPGLVRARVPVPLGGSSNHFPTALLRQLGAWDPYNVTEDADLGMRLHRHGKRTVIMDSTTWEEANSDFVNWMKQRSRWGKGYFISWLVQMRHPVNLWRSVGWRSFLAIQLTLGGTYIISLLNLAAWSLTALWILARFAFIAYLFPGLIYYVGMAELVFGNVTFVYLGLWAASHRRVYDLDRVALAAPLYWLMMSLAMLKATMQLFTRPAFWEKTVHGLYDTSTVGAETQYAVVATAQRLIRVSVPAAPLPAAAPAAPLAPAPAVPVLVPVKGVEVSPRPAAAPAALQPQPAQARASRARRRPTAQPAAPPVLPAVGEAPLVALPTFMFQPLPPTTLIPVLGIAVGAMPPVEVEPAAPVTPAVPEEAPEAAPLPTVEPPVPAAPWRPRIEVPSFTFQPLAPAARLNPFAGMPPAPVEAEVAAEPELEAVESKVVAFPLALVRLDRERGEEPPAAVAGLAINGEGETVGRLRRRLHLHVVHDDAPDPTPAWARQRLMAINGLAVRVDEEQTEERGA